MILTDREIQIALRRQAILIKPEPADDLYSSTSVDLTLDQTLTIFNEPTEGLDIIIDPTKKKTDTEKLIKGLTTRITITDEGYVMKPGKLILGYSKEYIDLRNDTKYAARVEGKSSLARLGLSVHNTAPTIHAGFDGCIRLEMVNHGAVPIRLRVGMPICQLIFEQTLGTPAKGYGEHGGQFSGQVPDESGQ
jgi:dCTP deaminase